MDILRHLLDSSDPPGEPHRTGKQEQFYDETTNASAVTVFWEDVSALKTLLDSEATTPIPDGETLAVGTVPTDVPTDELSLRMAHEQLLSELNRLATRWEDQLDASPSSVWLPDDYSVRMETYLRHCEERIDNDADPFSPPRSFGRVRSLVGRCSAADNDDAASAFVGREHVPLTDSERR
ncbi:hypothetical protein [Haloprofundus salilacus]|uniref:hypothetical protein n=1 Tax=Haloprofundus salilacus TaxID=2876190 RepID=UPI001CCDDF9E|nr:hypothetical protein [Haloprofundus salilacus]